MNYRTLLIISLLILFVGIAGIMFLPSGDETPAQQAAEQVEPEKKVEEKLILVAQLKRDVNKGRLLQAEDYALNEMTVTVDSPLVSNDVRDLAINNSLQGFLVAELGFRLFPIAEDPSFTKRSRVLYGKFKSESGSGLSHLYST